MDEASQQRTQQEETAYHEAGHALMAWLLGSSTQEIFVSSEGVIGYVRDLPISKRRGAVVRLVMVNMAGPIAHAPYLAGFDPNRDDPRASFQTGYPKVSGCADDHDVMREFANASEEGSMERLIVRLRISSKTGDTFNGWLGK